MEDKTLNTVTELLESTGSELKTIRAELDAAKKAGEAHAELRSKLDKVVEDVVKLSENYQRIKIAKEADTKESRNDLSKQGFISLVRNNGWTSDVSEDVRKAYATTVVEAYGGYEINIGGKNVRALSEANDPAAGYLVDPVMAAGIIKDILEFSPIRANARIIRTSGRSVQLRKRTGVASAEWVGEQSTRSESTGQTYGLVEVPVREMHAQYPATQWLLEDAAVDLESEIRMDISERFANTEGKAFTTGSGVLQPEGFMTDATLIANYVAGGETSTLTNASGIIQMIPKIKEQYSRNGKFYMNRNTYGDLLAMSDGAGSYLFPINESMPMKIKGYDIVLVTDMADVDTDSYPILFGDMRQLYTVVDRTDIRMQRDPYSSKSTGEVLFDFYKRVGGAVINPSAACVLKIATS